MKKLHESTLSSITGGYGSYRRLPTPALAIVAQISARQGYITPSNDEYDEAESYCHQHFKQLAPPKNGDRNALGQQYSWGTWWDDTH